MRNALQHIKNSLILLTAVFAFSLLISRESSASEKDELLANFIYNVVDYINWKKKSDINLCLYGHDDVTANLEHFDQKNKTTKTDALSNGRKVFVNAGVTFNTINSCDLLYIADSEEKNVLLILDKIKNYPMITASSLDNFITKGGVFEFKVMRRKVRLKIGPDALKRTGISLSPVLLMSVRPNENTTDSNSP